MIDDVYFFNEKLRECKDFYKYNRPHAALDGLITYERYRKKGTLRVNDLIRSHIIVTFLLQFVNKKLQY